MTEAEWLTSKIPRAMLKALIQPDSPTQYLRKLKPEDRAKARRLDRKLRLFACASVRRVWHLLEDERSRRAVEVSERYAEEMANPEELDAAGSDAHSAASQLYRVGGLAAADMASIEDRRANERPDSPVPGDTQAERIWEAAHAAYKVTSRKIGISPRINVVFDSAWAAVFGASRSASDALAGIAELRAREASYEAAVKADDVPACRYYEDSCQSNLLRCIFGNPFRPVYLEPAWLTPDSVMLARSIDEGRSFDLMAFLGDALEEMGCSDVAVLNHCRQLGEHARGCWVIDAMRGVV